MLTIRFPVGLLIIGWLCLSASVCAQAISFISPNERPQPEASKP